MSTINRIVAERILEFHQSEGAKPRKMRVRIRAPQRKGSDWVVSYEIRGPGIRREKLEAWGADSMQALHIAMANVPVYIRGIEMLTGGKVTFLGGEHLMFPSLK